MPTLDDLDFTSRTGNISLLSAPLANNSIQGRNNERAWPGSFYAIDVLTGLDDMAVMLKQRHPSIAPREAFQAVFGIDHFALSTWKKHRKTYSDNEDLAAKFRALGHAPNATWKCFYFESKQAPVTVDDNSDNECSGSRDMAREASVISIDDNSAEELGDTAMETVVEVSDEENMDENSNLESDSDKVDWTLMCPYCDLKLPLESSTELKTMRAALDLKSIVEGCSGISSNPHHRYIRPFTSTLNHCTRHRFESDFANVLHKTAWASALPIRFEDLENRVILLLDILQEVVNYPLDNEFHQHLKESVAANGERRAFGLAGQYNLSGFISTG